MRRRDFIKAISVVVTWPLAARAQQPASSVPIVTFMNARRADAGAAVGAEFRKGLSQTGLTEGKDIVVEYHWLDGHYEDIPAILNEAIRRHVAVISTPGNSPASLAAKAATSTIPIVFGVSEDPVALGLVASLAHPGANVTGINFFASEIDAKRLGLMHELLPKAKRFAALVNPNNAPTAEATTKALKERQRLGFNRGYQGLNYSFSAPVSDCSMAVDRQIRFAFANRIGHITIGCQPHDQVRYGRTVAICFKRNKNLRPGDIRHDNPGRHNAPTRDNS